MIIPKMIKLSDRAYSVAETPCTWGQWEFYCQDVGIDLPNFPCDRPENWRDYPIVNVSWHDAMAYCDWLSKTTGRSFRLPTEDEFEHFCGDHKEATKKIAVYDQSSIQPVKTKEPNRYGLYDVLGLVWEWTGSRYE